MNVLLVTGTTFPEGMAATNKIKYLSLASKEAGATISVLASASGAASPHGSWGAKGEWNDIPYTLLRDKPKMSGWRNTLWLQVEQLVLVWKALRMFRSVDLYFVYLDKFVARWVLLTGAHFLGKKVALQLVEYPYTTDGDKLTRIPWVRKRLRKWTLEILFPKFDGFDCITTPLSDLARAHSKAGCAFAQTPILTDAQEWLECAKETAHLPQGTYTFHAGALSENKDGIVNYFRALGLLNARLQKEGKEPLRMGFTNMKTLPATKAKIDAVIDEFGMQDLVFVTGYLSKESLIAHINGARILLYNKPTNLQNDHNFPIKLADYLMSSAPVVVGSEKGEMHNYLNSGNAFVVTPDDPQAMADAAYELLINPERAAQMGLAGRKTVEQYFDYRNYGSMLKAFYESIIASL